MENSATVGISYPLLFEPILKEKVWGGRNLETVLGKKLPPGVKVGESWEISDHKDNVSVVRNGPLRGKTLRELLGGALLGTPLAAEERFPLLVKFIDACDRVSIQVHPSDEVARRFREADTGKYEAWYVVWCRQDAGAIWGLKTGTSKETLSRALSEGKIEELLHFVNLRAGALIPVPPGTVHAIWGALIAEIQQVSDCTYRLYDWKRIGLDGRPRELHIEKALEAIDFSTSQEVLPEPKVLKSDGYRHLFLHECEKFVLELFEIPPGAKVDQWQDTFSTFIVVEGSARFMHGGCSVSVIKGDSVLVPAAIGHFQIKAEKPLRILKALPPK